jgi:hypothetical protein
MREKYFPQRDSPRRTLYYFLFQSSFCFSQINVDIFFSLCRYQSTCRGYNTYFNKTRNAEKKNVKCAVKHPINF